MWQLNSILDGLSWPSISFAILIASLGLSWLVLWRRYQSRRHLMQRVAELETLSGAGRAMVSAALDVNTLCELIAEQSGQVIDSSTFQLGLFEDGCYIILFWTVDGQRQETPQRFELGDSAGLVGWVRDSKSPLLVRDFKRELDSLPARPRYLSQSPPRSAIFIPLISGDETIGILAAQSNKPNTFSEEDLRRLMILSNQAAAAIAHAQLFEQERMRALHLGLVSQIARQINTVQEQEEIFAQVVHLIRETFDFHPVLIFSAQGDAEELRIQASSAPSLIGRGLRLKMGQGLVGTAAATRRMIVSNRTSDDERFINHFPGVPDTSVQTMAEIAIPLIVDDTVLGVLDVHSAEPGVFTGAEITALEALAAEVAIAINKARQLAQQRQQAWVTTAQLQVAAAIDQNDELEDILATVTRLTSMLVGLSGCGILLWDEEMEVYRGSTFYGPDRAQTERFGRLVLRIGDWGPLDAVHVGHESLQTEIPPPWLAKNAAADLTGGCPTMLLPICARERILGVMAVDGTVTYVNGRPSAALEGHRFELLENIVGQIASAVDSARLRIAQQEEAWVNTALLQVAEAVNSLIDLNEILDTIVRLVPMLVGVRSAIILIWDEEQQAYRAGPSHGVGEMGRGLLEAHGIEQDDFLSVSTRSAEFLTPTATYYSMRLPPWLVKALGTPMAHAFPLNARGQLVGAMLVGTDSESGYNFSSRRLNILNGIAQQAATAVVNNHLYKESAERNRLEQELEVARGIQANLIPSGSPDIPGCSVASYWLAARQVSGDFYDFLKLPNGCWSVVIADVADKGVPAALFMALSRTILRTVAFNRTDPADVLIRTNQIINSDAQSELFVTVFYGIWDPDSFTLTYANGGHNPPLLLRKNGGCQALVGRGMALGVLPQIAVESRAVKIEPGDTLVFYTDGVTEAMNEDFDEFGLERLRLAAEAAAGSDAADIVESITDAIDDHAGGTPQFDDITLVIMRRHD